MHHVEKVYLLSLAHAQNVKMSVKRMHRSGQMERNAVRSAQVFPGTTYKIVKRFLLSKHGGHSWARLVLKVILGMHLQVVVQVAWGGSYMGQPVRMCF